MYRADINGLRALAVSLVILNHAGLTMFKGGFIGVDIFFIISGFLITLMITKKLDDKTFSFRDFYANRAKRILPAFHLVCLASVVLSYFFLLSTDFSNTIVSMISGLFFVKNFSLMMGVSNYFDTLVTAQFFIHIWSLSVEEQFYILWPLLLIAAFKLRIKYIFLIVVCVIGSLWFSENLISSDAKSAYYLVLSRIFQFAIGASIVFLPSTKNLKINQVLSSMGLALIVISLIVINKDTPYPGLYALLPSIGTALIIYSGALSMTFIHKIFSHRFLNHTGLISYSLYLWHWPIFVLLGYLQYTMTTPVIFFAITATYLIATLSYYLVENPLRYRKVSNQTAFFQYFFIPTGVLLCSIAIVDQPSFQGDIAKNHYQILKDEQLECFSLQPTDKLPNIKNCTKDPDKKPDALIWGDSHAAYMSNFISQLDVAKAQNYVHITHAACPPVIEPYFVYKEGEKVKPEKSCITRNKQVMEYIKNQEFKSVYLVARWPLYIKGDVKENWRDLKIFMVDQLGDESISIENNHAIFEKKLMQTIKELIALNITPVIIQNAPGNFRDPSRCNQINELYFANKINCHQEIDYVKENNILVNNTFNRIDEKYNAVKFIPVAPLLCNKEICSSVLNNKPVFYDDDHLSVAGAVSLGIEYMKTQTQTLKETPINFTLR